MNDTSSDTAPLPTPRGTHWLVTSADGRPLAIADARTDAEAVHAVIAHRPTHAANDASAAPCTWVRRPLSLDYLDHESVRRLTGH